MTAMMMASVASPVRPETRAATSSRSSNGLRSCPQYGQGADPVRADDVGPIVAEPVGRFLAGQTESLLPSRFSTSSARGPRRLQHALIAFQLICREQPHIGRHDLPDLKCHHVAGHQLGHVDVLLTPVPPDHGLPPDPVVQLIRGDARHGTR